MKEWKGMERNRKEVKRPGRDVTGKLKNVSYYKTFVPLTSKRSKTAITSL
jgi:hypothetical protein